MSRETDRTLQRLMSISHAEFLRCLEPLARDYPCHIEESGRRIVLTAEAGEIDIRLGEEGVRRLGALTLPETAVTFHFESGDDEAVERFLSRFDLCFRRGGG